MSDNGAGGRNGPLSGGEGGIRVPLFISGPGIEANSWSHQAIVGNDFYNTFAEWAGYTKPLPKGIEGGSITHLLKGDETPVTRSREGLVFHFPHYQGDTPHSTIIKGDYKLLHFYETNSSQLYNLAKDLRESKDLSGSKPELAVFMEAELLSRLQATGADLPVVNPNTTPITHPRINVAVYAIVMQEATEKVKIANVGESAAIVRILTAPTETDISRKSGNDIPGRTFISRTVIIQPGHEPNTAKIQYVCWLNYRS